MIINFMSPLTARKTKRKLMENFLTSLKLQQYIDAFDEQGFDDLDFLKTLSEEQFESCMVTVGVTKMGHMIRIKNGLKAANLAPTSPEPAATASTEDTTPPTPTSPTTTSPNEISPQITFFNHVLKEVYETAYDSAVPRLYHIKTLFWKIDVKSPL